MASLGHVRPPLSTSRLNLEMPIMSSQLQHMAESRTCRRAPFRAQPTSSSRRRPWAEGPASASACFWCTGTATMRCSSYLTLHVGHCPAGSALTGASSRTVAWAALQWGRATAGARLAIPPSRNGAAEAGGLAMEPQGTTELAGDRTLVLVVHDPHRTVARVTTAQLT